MVGVGVDLGVAGGGGFWLGSGVCVGGGGDVGEGGRDVLVGGSG